MNIRRIAPAVAVAALAAGLATTAPAAQAAPHSQVRIGAVQADSPGRDNGTNNSLNSEWVTITNTGRNAVNLRGYTLTGTSRGSAYRFGSFRLGGHQTVKVHTGRGHNTGRDVYENRRSYVWGNSRDTATLRDNRNHLVDAKSWGSRRGNDHGHGHGH